MIAFLPMVILGVPLILALIDLIAMRSGKPQGVAPEGPPGRHVGVHTGLRRGDQTPPATYRTMNRRDVPANCS